jgi:hypothetical protein
MGSGENKLGVNKILKIELTSYDSATLGRELNCFYPLYPDYDLKKYAKAFDKCEKENIVSIQIKYIIERV